MRKNFIATVWVLGGMLLIGSLGQLIGQGGPHAAIGVANTWTALQTFSLGIQGKGIPKIYLASDYTSGSLTGGIQEAIAAVAAAGGGEVEVRASVPIATAAINMAAGVNVRGIGDDISVTFTSVTNGFVWPNTANYARLYNLGLVAGNGSSGKAIDIEDASSAAADVVVEDVRLSATNAPTTVWAYCIFLKNAQLERFSRIKPQSCTVPIHTEGYSNSVDFDSINLTANVASTTYVDIQGGAPITFLAGEIEGNASGELVKITQPGAAATYVNFQATAFENANGTGKGIHANDGRFECHDCTLSLPAQLAFVIGDVSTTTNCKIIGGSGASWTFGAHESLSTVLGYYYTGADPVDSSGGLNLVLGVTGNGDYVPMQSIVVGPPGLEFLQDDSIAGPVMIQQGPSDSNDLFQWLNSSAVVQGRIDGSFRFSGPGAIFTAAAPTVSVSQIGFGGTTAAASSCGSLSGAAGCVVINVAGTPRYVPYW
jgi:hypothetical protein